MKKLSSLLLAFVVAVTVQSCNGKKDDQQEVVAPAGMITLDLSKYGKPFTLFVPDTTSAKLEVIEQTWGALEIKVGKDFQLSITEDPGDMELRKSDITSDEVNKFKAYIVEEPTTILWESEITKPEFHLYSIQKLGASNYVFEDIKTTDGEPMSKESVERMLESVKSMKEVKKEAA